MQISAGVIVSNADMRQTLEQLIGVELLDPDYLAGIGRLRPTHPCFLMHFGLKDISLDALRKIEGYHWSSWNAEDLATNAFKIFVPTGFDPSLAPPGGQIAIIQKLTRLDYDAIGDWLAHKRAIEENILQSLERCLPGFSRCIAIKLGATAETAYRYTLNYHGAMLGWEMSPDQLGEARPGIAGRLKNLYFVGHWTQPGGGITPVMISAMQAAKQITGNRNLSAPPPSAEIAMSTQLGAMPA